MRYDKSDTICEAGIATLVRRVDKPSITVGMDGGLYRFHPEFNRIVTKTISDLLQNKYKVSSSYRIYLLAVAAVLDLVR